MAKTIFPDGTFEAYQYDANGNELQRTMRDGQIITSQYDQLNQLISRFVPGAPIHTITYPEAGTVVIHSFTYDLAGRQLTATHDGVTLGFAYDSAGRLAAKTHNGGMPVSYQYDAASNPTKMTYPDGWDVDFTYDALNRVISAAHNDGMGTVRELAAVDYDLLSRRTGSPAGPSSP